MTDGSALSDQQIHHLDMLQGVIGRLASNSFLIKGWAVTVVGAFLGFAVNSKDGALAVASIVPTIAFWGLDTYFLRSERLFRALYERLRTTPTGVEAFFMGATSPTFIGSINHDVKPDPSSWWQTVFRPTLRLLYGALIVSAAIVAAAIWI